MRLLSKSKILAYRQCAKRLWLEVHRPDLRMDSGATQARFQTGYDVGAIARRIYDPNATGALIDVGIEGFDAAFERSRELLSNSTAPVFEAGLRTDDALAFADVMLPTVIDGQLVWRMIEVKSSTAVKEYHRDDIAVQSFVARSAGVPLASVALAHIDSSWVYPGGGDYCGLLSETDMTAEAFARTDEIAKWISEAQAITALTDEPEKPTGATLLRSVRVWIL
jgi:hypothetical protein